MAESMNIKSSFPKKAITMYYETAFLQPFLYNAVYILYKVWKSNILLRLVYGMKSTA